MTVSLAPDDAEKRIGIRYKPTSGNIIEAQIVTEPWQAEIAYGMRYTAYRDYGFVDERQDGLFNDEYDRQKNYVTILIFRNDVAVATIRVALFDPEHSDPDFHKTRRWRFLKLESDPSLRRSVGQGYTARQENLGSWQDLMKRSRIWKSFSPCSVPLDMSGYTTTLTPF